MTRFYRYAEWDGTQEFPELDSGELMDQLSEQIMSHSDLSYALRMMYQSGLRQQGRRLSGIQDLLQRLRALRREHMERYNLPSALQDLQRRLDQIVQKERQGIQGRLDEARQRAAQPQGPQEVAPGQEGLSPEAQRRLLQALEERAARNREFLDRLPPDLGDAIQQLSQYDFMDHEARQEFQQLLKELQQAVLQSFFKELTQQLQAMTPADLDRLRQMVQELNRLLQEKLQGAEPDFQRFMDQYGDYFRGLNPQSLQDLVEKMQRQMAQLQSLLDSLPPEMREELRELINSKLLQPGLANELAQLAMNLERLFPGRQLHRQYPFQGDESLTLQQALRLMEQLQQLDELERQLEKTRMGADLSTIDADRLRQLLGAEAHEALERLKQLVRLLEEHGYIQRKGEKYELTPRGIRRIGQKALGDIFTHLKRDRFGHHAMERQGMGAEMAEDTKRYEFGDPFLVHLERTLMNAMHRGGPGVPLRLLGEDFEVFRTEHQTHASIVLMLDLSWSMVLRGNFLAAKKVALALNSLIRSQFPKDTLFVVGFSDYARELKGEMLPYLNSNEAVYGTNMQHGLILSQKLLDKQPGRNKQIIMITDGEPTAYIENGQSYFEYPPTPIIFRETLREVKRCTQKGITINVFMLDRSDYLKEFINQLTRLNRGRAFYTSADHLGQYILVDYLKGKRRKLF